MDSVSQQRLQLVCPTLSRIATQLLQKLSSENIPCRVVQGLRTYAQQAALFAQGRSAPGPKVTNAPPGSSYHNYGLAVDVVPGIVDEHGRWAPDWEEIDGHHYPPVLKPNWARMIELGEGLGLTSGRNFHHLPDYPHFQLTGSLPYGCPPREAKDLLLTQGLQAVWHMAGFS